MRTAAICPTCATYINAVCVIYDGPNLLNINTLTLDNLELILENIDMTVGGINTTIGGINTSISTINTSISTLTANLALKEDTINKSNDGTLSANSPILFPTQQAVKTYADGLVVGLLDDRGNFTPSVTSPGPYPSTNGSGPGGTVVKGDIWFVDANGYLGTTAVGIGASVRALVDNPTTAADWDILDATLGIVPENVANKVTTKADVIAYGSSTVKYPAVKAIKDYVDDLVSTSVGAVGLQQVLAVGNSAIDESIGMYNSYDSKVIGIASNPAYTVIQIIDSNPISGCSTIIRSNDISVLNSNNPEGIVIMPYEISFTDAAGGDTHLQPTAGASGNVLFLPAANTNATLVTSVNGQVANSAGDVTIPTGNILTVKISVTNSQVLNLATAPKLLVAAQGVGKVIRLMDASIAYNHNTTAFSSTQLRFTMGGLAIAANAVLALSTTGIGFSFVPNTNLTAAQSNNQALYLTTLTNPTSGDGSLDVYVTYQVITL